MSQKSIRRRNSVNNFGWIEIKLYSGLKNSLGTYMSFEEYNWLCNCFIDNISESFLESGKRVLFFKNFSPQKYILTSIENKKVYGLELTYDELDKIYYMNNWIKILH